MLGVIAEIAGRATSEHDHAPDLFDVLTLIFAGFAAVGTVGAVLVALFGPSWQARRTKPQLSITANDGSTSLEPQTPNELSLASVEVSNASGRRQADDVEVLATVAAPLSSEFGNNAGMIVVEQEQLVYASYPSQAVTAAIPPGFSRRLAFCVAGYRYDLDRRYRFTVKPRPPEDEWLVVVAASASLRSGRYATLEPGAAISIFYVLFEAVARDVDTVRFVGRFELTKNASGVRLFVWLDHPAPADAKIVDHDSFTSWLSERGTPSAHITIGPPQDSSDEDSRADH